MPETSAVDASPDPLRWEREDDRARLRLAELHRKLASPTDYAGRDADLRELAALEGRAITSRDVAAARSDVALTLDAGDPHARARATATLERHGFTTATKLASPDLATPVASMSAADRKKQIALLEKHVTQPALANPQHVARLNELQQAERTGGATRAPTFAEREAAEKNRLYAELASLGDPRGRAAGDTIESLRDRRTTLLQHKREAWDEAQAQRRAMGLDGTQGTDEQVARYTLREGIASIRGDSTTGSIFTNYGGALLGSDVDDVQGARHRGQLGGNLEDAAGGVATVYEHHRSATAPHDTTESPRAADIAPRGVDKPKTPLGMREAPPSRVGTPVVELRPHVDAPTISVPTPAARPPTRPLPRDAAPRMAYQQLQRLPGGKHWGDVAVTSEEHEQHYNELYAGRGTKTPANVRADYDAGIRYDPDSRSRRTMKGSAVYGTANDALRPNEVSREHRIRIAAAAKVRDEQDARLRVMKRDGASDEQTKAQEQRLRDATRVLGEVGADAYVATRFPGPPPPQRVWPPPALANDSRSGEFDQVWKVASRHGGTTLIVEAKGNGARRVTRAVGETVEAEQGTARYVESVIAAMRRSTNPETRSTARQLQIANDARDIVYIEVRTLPDHNVYGRDYDITVDTGTRGRRR